MVGQNKQFKGALFLKQQCHLVDCSKNVGVVFWSAVAPTVFVKLKSEAAAAKIGNI